ncbi:hypothetical protein ASPWEDRAFT_172338 [Aspergillus wentii DTO 134E9]|uniref:PEBP-like protein n=1 Tax=Aspergillus wentii DTO 134E9 TaxID=1073089 RepID=A0A1L9RKS4_ASPWE|nr:uncharacterized protein ASPWEDRAFT_172338 [Aspergillus wentii DTO 134E9]KAI9924698.1 hypothetical protein MW887_006550 [Aspergillus wentii]OJJ35536.1 hypothetical protein ASPWEDRAFT_172338 [Aspergillus wentii DTO 134E9]
MIWKNYILSALCLAVQTCLATNATVVVNYNGKVLDEPGQLVNIPESHNTPTFGLTQLPPSTGPFVLIMVDQGKSDILHLIQSDLHLSPQEITVADTSYYSLSSQSKPDAKYIAPTPLLPPKVHKYVELLFVQPEGFKIPRKFKKYMPGLVPNRLNFPLDEFVEETGLGESVAESYFNEKQVLT